jgi:predicted esterase
LEAIGERRAIVLTLHGAGVDSLNQARSYSAKPDLEILAPTNRRPFGFDWQDWGRFDAYEALGERPGEGGGKRWPVYLTGHSMGGHGAWSLAVLDPDRFRAVAPSAGWCSFDTYGGRPEGELAAIWRAADAVSLVDQGVENLRSVPIYVLHGAADDNVPVAEAQDMARRLEEVGARFELHVREGAGHWWDGDRAPGADCVDWPEIFELFGRTLAEPDWETCVWRSVDPGVDGSHAWLSFLAPRRWGEAARFEGRWMEGEGRVELATENVARFALQGDVGEACRELIVDGQRLSFAPGDADQVELLRRENSWTVYRPGRDTPVGQQKSPRSAGPFKRAFDRRFLVVIGTAGDGAEDRELIERARFDVGTWWYRANATPEVYTDVEFLALEKKPQAERNVILYGNRDTNSAWAQLIGASPVDARRGALVVGEREFQGDDLGAVFVRPRRDVSTGALVGAFADTGIAGARSGYRLAPFISGVGYPDYAVFSKEILTRGDGGVLAAGWFDEAWQLQSGGFLCAPAAADEAGR